MMLNATIYAQELEPRSLVNLPVDTNFIVGGYAYGQGNYWIPDERSLLYLRDIHFIVLTRKDISLQTQISHLYLFWILFFEFWNLRCSGCGAVRLACLTGGQEVGSSNLPTPTLEMKQLPRGLTMNKLGFLGFLFWRDTP